MGKLLAASAIVLLLCVSPAFAQWSRLTLNDGRVIDGQITGGDANHYYVQTQHGYFSIARANVVAVTTDEAPLPPPPQARKESSFDITNPLGLSKGARVGIGTYVVTGMLALARMDKDDDAKYGLIPIAGPLMWAIDNDEDKFLSDGWDYLALTSTLCQAGGLLMMVTGVGNSQRGVAVAPVSGRNYGGIAVAGNW